MSSTRFLMPMVLGSFLAVLAEDATAQKIYWTDYATDTVSRANLDGSQMETLVGPSADGPNGISLDLVEGRMYWAGWSGIYRANLDGSDRVRIIDTRPLVSMSVSVDALKRKIYYTTVSFNTPESRILRADLDGGNVELLLTIPQDATGGLRTIVVDSLGEMIYWGAYKGNVSRATLDGANVEVVYESEDFFGWPLTVDPVGGKLYWAEWARGMGLHRANLDGSDPVELPIRASSIRGIAVDPSVDQLYFCDQGAAYIRRVNEDGTGHQPLVWNVLDRARELRFDPTEGRLYWLNQRSEIRCARPDGTELEVLLQTEDLLRWLMLDVAYGKMYYADQYSGVLWRADLDGTNVEDLIAVDAPEEVVLNHAEGKMYWADTDAGAIKRADLSGSNIEVLLSNEYWCPGAITLDPAGGKMYWADFCLERILRADLDGTNVEYLITSGVVYPYEIVMETLEGKMYWTDRDSHTISRANLDGTGVESLADTSLQTPRSLVLDVQNRTMYWRDDDNLGPGALMRAPMDGGASEVVAPGCDRFVIDFENSKLIWAYMGEFRRSNLDGSDVELLVTNVLDVPTGIAVDASCGGLDCQPNGIGDACEPDADGDGTPDDCDGCPDDPSKADPGACGCGVMDSDLNQNGVPDCLDDGFVPTTSAWTLFVLTLALLTGGRLIFRRYDNQAAV